MNGLAKNSFAIARQETIFGEERRGIGLTHEIKEKMNDKMT